MPTYMTQFAYTADAWAALVKKPEDRGQVVRGLVEKMGGRYVNLYYHFGEYDGTLLFEAPDDPTANSIILAAISPGHLKATRTTRLFSVEETLESLRKAAKVPYRAPGR